MRTRTFVWSGAIALALGAGSPLTAQVPVDAELAPFVGGSFWVSDARAPLVVSRREGAELIVQDGELSNAPAVGFSAGLRVADRVGLEGMFAWAPTRVVGEAPVPQRRRVADVTSIRYGVSLLYHFAQRGPVRPFAGAAVTAESLSPEQHLGWEGATDTAGALALGAHLPISDRLSARFQALQDVVGRSDRSGRDQLMLTAGLSYRQPVR